ncbi:unnamed protein product [Cunninghamella echinulata]
MRNVLNMVKLFTLSLVSTYIISIYGTYINVNKGCILINGSPRCHGGSKASINGDSAVIFAQYNGNDKNTVSKPQCVLNARWPSNYGDVYFGDNNCLYDASGAMINGQCCQTNNNLQYTINPYR